MSAHEAFQPPDSLSISSPYPPEESVFPLGLGPDVYIHVDTENRIVRGEGSEQLTIRDTGFAILTELARHPNRLVSKNQLSQAGQLPNSHTLGYHFARLRQSLGIAANGTARSAIIQSVTTPARNGFEGLGWKAMLHASVPPQLRYLGRAGAFIVIDTSSLTDRRILAEDGTSIRLSPPCFRLLAALAEHPTEALSRSELLAEAGLQGAGDSLTTHIKVLREKLGTTSEELPRHTAILEPIMQKGGTERGRRITAYRSLLADGFALPGYGWYLQAVRSAERPHQAKLRE